MAWGFPPRAFWSGDARSYTVIECNADVIETFQAWRTRYPDVDIRLIPTVWQDALQDLGTYDGILFDTYPLSQEEDLRNEVELMAYTHAGEFFPVAAQKLKPGGVFTYFSCEIDTLSRGHQRLLFDHFNRFAVDKVTGLQPPQNCTDWWADSMVVDATRH
ncbi:MAG: class I SAM-dependent methyltransferase [Pseudomonadota bacterium]